MSSIKASVPRGRAAGARCCRDHEPAAPRGGVALLVRLLLARGGGRERKTGINGLLFAVRFFEDPQKCSPYAALLSGLGQRVAGLAFCMLTASECH